MEYLIAIAPLLIGWGADLILGDAPLATSCCRVWQDDKFLRT